MGVDEVFVGVGELFHGVAEQQVEVGGQVGGGMPVLSVADTDRLVTLDLPASQRNDVAEGDTLNIELSDGTATTGVVEEVSSTITTDPQSGSQTVAVTVRLADDADGASDGPVTVSVVRYERKDVLAVPVGALLALLEGGYAVEVVDGAASGGTRFMGVEVGLFADGWVEITNATEAGLAEGDEVIVP
jgi:hypothetical protein